MTEGVPLLPLTLNVRLDLRVERMEGAIYQERLADACVLFVQNLGVTGGVLHTDAFTRPIPPPRTRVKNMKDPSLLSHTELAEIVAGIQSILWADGDPDREWDSETIECVAGTLHDHELSPDKKPTTKTRKRR